jgi:hypothetical protein
MREKCGLWLVALVVLSLISVFVPHQAFAQSAPTTPTATSDCAAGGPKAGMNAQAANNTAANAQAKMIADNNINSLFPIIQATDACIQKLTDLIAQLPTLGNPFSLAGALVTQLIIGVIGQVCSSVAGVISSAQNALTSFAHICLPLPKFGGLDLPNFPSASGCTSGTQLNLLTSFSGGAAPPYNYNQFQSH